MLEPSFSVTITEVIQKSQGTNKILDNKSVIWLAGEHTKIKDLQIENSGVKLENKEV